MNLIDFLSGAITLGFAVTGLFFLRFWKRAGDRLFLAFALAFWLMAASQLGYSVLGQEHEHAALLYLLRVAAYALIIAAIVGKNVGHSRE